MPCKKRWYWGWNYEEGEGYFIRELGLVTYGWMETVGWWWGWNLD